MPGFFVTDTYYLRKREMIQMMTAMTAMTIKIPTPIPAWKMSPTNSHPINVVESRTISAE